MPMSNGMDRIVTGDAFDEISDLEEDSAHAVVTDPPYGLAFMGKSWDDFEPREYQDWCQDWGEELLRVIKPGGHLVAFSGNRTHHRLFSGLEDAGWTVRDTLTWHFGGGMPKGLDVAKGVDSTLGVEGEYGDPKSERHASMVKTGRHGAGDSDGWGRDWMDDEDAVNRYARTYLPESDTAKHFDGFRTGLKPSTEFAVLARAPLEEDTISENVIEHGTGALNIGECRLPSDDGEARSGERFDGDGATNFAKPPGDRGGSSEGRYPSHLLIDEYAAAAIDAQAGESGGASSGPAGRSYELDDDANYGDGRVGGIPSYNDSGGPSRFFYTAKASTAERTLNGAINNDHPTVKPIDLMEWIVKLVTADGQTVLDPFAGSGTTCLAAKNTGRKFVGIEIDERWADVARVRCGLSPDDPSHVRIDDGQAGIEAYTDGGKHD